MFCVLYFGTYAIIGLASPAFYYSPFVDKYLDYVSGLKNTLLYSTAFLLSLFHIPTEILPGFIIKISGGKGVIVAQSCVGIGVYSFWIAFVAANKGSFWRKVKWIFGGLLSLWFINDVRITLFLLAVNKGWPNPLGMDHHTWFNIFAYLLIFVLIWWYDKKSKILENKTK
ncbi:MAG: exosortase/archaeosortase family protein [Ginsengibacter sp.]